MIKTNKVQVLFIVILCSLTSCAWNPVQQDLAHREFNRVFEEFKAESSVRNIELKRLKSVEFINIKETFPESKDWVGLCENNDKIYFDQQWWMLSHSLDREQVIIHELGHCLLDLEHQDSGIMSEKRIPIDKYYRNKNKLISDVFDLYQKGN